MIILDTNVLSALMHAKPDPVVVSWLDLLPAESIWITCVTLFEARYGLALLPQGKRRTMLTTQFEGFVEEDLEGRVLLFDNRVADQAALLATRNIRLFDDLTIQVVNPWEEK